MAIKSFSDLQQSKKLTEILPIESADMYYLAKPDDTNSNMVTSDICIPRRSENDGQAFGETCAWSLTALLSVLQYPTLFQRADKKWDCTVWIDFIKPYSIKAKDNPVDACYELILKLHELKML